MAYCWRAMCAIVWADFFFFFICVVWSAFSWSNSILHLLSDCTESLAAFWCFGFFLTDCFPSTVRFLVWRAIRGDKLYCGAHWCLILQSVPFSLAFFFILLFTHPPSSLITEFAYSPRGEQLSEMWVVCIIYVNVWCPVPLNRLFLSISGKKTWYN